MWSERWIAEKERCSEGVTVAEILAARVESKQECPFLKTPVGQACVRAVELEPGTVNQWSQQARLKRKFYDSASLSVEDVQVLLRFQGPRKPVLPIEAMTALQRSRDQKAARSVQQAERRKFLESEAADSRAARD